MEYGSLFAVKDINRTRKFYEELFGLKVSDDYGRNIAFEGGLAFQEDFDWLTGIPKDSIVERPNNSEIWFMMEGFDEFVDELKSRDDIEILHDIIAHDWGQRVIRFYDPDKHLVEVGETLTEVINRFKSDGMNIEQIAKLMDITVEDIHRILEDASE